MEKQIDVKKIIKKAKNNDNNAFNVLINTFWEGVYMFILNKTKDRERAIEITQLAFLKVFYRISTYKEEFDFKNWVVTIAYNIFRDQQRRKNNIFIIIDNLLVDSNPSQLEALITEEDKKFLRKAVDHLKPKFKNVIIKHYYQEMSFGNIACELNISEGNVRTTLHRARKELFGIYIKN